MRNCSPSTHGGRRRSEPSWHDFEATTRGGYKLHHIYQEDRQIRVELYHIATDSGERHNLATKEPARAEALLKELERFYQPPAAVVEKIKLDDPVEAKLKSLGYLNGP